MQVKPKPYPCVTVHSLSQAVAALAPGRPITLLSAPGAAGFAGCGWWRALVGAARARHPNTSADDILDCGDAAGRALEALGSGQKALVLRPECPGWRAVAAAAEECGACILTERPHSLDLALPGRPGGLNAWLAQHRQ